MSVVITRKTNQARELALYAKEFMLKGKPAESVLARTAMFHTDSVLCGISAIAMGTNAPTVLRKEALKVFGDQKIKPKTQLPFKARLFGENDFSTDIKAIVANCSAVREWDSNGTVFGFREADPEHQAGEFGHNDFYPVVLAAAENNPDVDGAQALKAMVLLDEIRGRLAESFSLKTYKIDHVVHGAIASAVTYGTLLGASVDQIESAVGMFLAHYIPFRAIRAGHQLSDSKGASAALSTEAAILSLHRSMNGFVGPKDIFRNPQAIFRLFTKTEAEESPFDLKLGFEGDDFAVMGMHFKLGLYEHQSAGAIQSVIDLLASKKLLADFKLEDLDKISIEIYEPAFGIIGDPHKRNPTTRQSADHSMVFIIASVIKKAFAKQAELKDVTSKVELWKALILTPHDYSPSAIADPTLRKIMDLIEFRHGGSEYDQDYPRGIPTSLSMSLKKTHFKSKKVLFPSGHAHSSDTQTHSILKNKFQVLAKLALPEDKTTRVINRLNRIGSLSNKDLCRLYSLPIQFAEKPLDSL